MSSPLKRGDLAHLSIFSAWRLLHPWRLCRASVYGVAGVKPFTPRYLSQICAISTSQADSNTSVTITAGKWKVLRGKQTPLIHTVAWSSGRTQESHTLIETVISINVLPEDSGLSLIENKSPSGNWWWRLISTKPCWLILSTGNKYFTSTYSISKWSECRSTACCVVRLMTSSHSVGFWLRSCFCVWTT